MDREAAAEVGEPPKRTTPLSTVSLDSTYDHAGTNDDRSNASRDKWNWAPFVVLVGLTLIAVGLVLALDRGDDSHEEAAAGPPNNEEDPSFSTTSASDGRNLTAPQKKLEGWLKEIRNASELHVEADSSNMSLTGVLFPDDSSEKDSGPFDQVVSIDYAASMPSQQVFAIAGGRGYKWSVTKLDFGETYITGSCLSKKYSPPLNDLASVVSTARWRSDDPNRRDVQVRFDGEKYIVSKVEDDSDDSDDDDTDRCWLIKSEEVALSACIPDFDKRFSKSYFMDVLQATIDCPNLMPQAVNRGKSVLVPLPLRKWYASYNGSRSS